jgi:hypothetical protein
LTHDLPGKRNARHVTADFHDVNQGTMLRDQNKWWPIRVDRIDSQMIAAAIEEQTGG